LQLRKLGQPQKTKNNPKTVLSLLAYKDISDFEYQELINRENSVKLLFEFNKVINDQDTTVGQSGPCSHKNDIFTQTTEDQEQPMDLLEDNRVSYKITRYEPLLFQEFREFYYKQGFFNDDRVKCIRRIESKNL
jgi:hypothetical protein